VLASPSVVPVERSCADLVRAIADGRPGADRELVARFQAHARRLLIRTLGPGPDVDDLLQEVFFRVFQRLHKIEPPDALPGYVTTVTLLVAREALRKRRRARWLSFLGGDELASLTEHRGAEAVPEDVRAFYGALGKVSAQAQLLITLRYVEGMRLEEVGAALDLSLATVKRHLTRAEADLTALLGDDDVSVAPWLRGALR
jgi:RNA polymerase sigma-70 factor, ECF subfamily